MRDIGLRLKAENWRFHGLHAIMGIVIKKIWEIVIKIKNNEKNQKHCTYGTAAAVH